ncbi:MAG: ISL3 family transposase, partial [Prolixibacteraceae bacterium]|nr:ISL3 family transposase [Prolixibacteraceae bacterium]
KKEANRMQIQTILNSLEKYSSFIYDKCELVGKPNNLILKVKIKPRKNGKPACSICGNKGSIYDHQPKPREFDFVPMWGMAVIFVYTMRRVNCHKCGVKIEQVPWAKGKSPTTITYTWFLARWAKMLSWSDTAKMFKTSWSTVFNSVEMAVEWGRAMLSLENVSAIGVDEIKWQRGHKYLTVVYQIDEGMRRLLWVGDKRKVKTLLKFFRWFGKERTGQIKFIASDMWKPYLKVIKYKACHAVHVLDRFHIVAMMGKAVDKVRNQEAKDLAANGYEPMLKNARWPLLKREENLTTKQDAKLSELLKYNLKSVRAYLLKQNFQMFWEYTSPAWAEKFLDKWCFKTMRSKIEPMKK